MTALLLSIPWLTSFSPSFASVLQSLLALLHFGHGLLCDPHLCVRITGNQCLVFVARSFCAVFSVIDSDFERMRQPISRVSGPPRSFPVCLGVIVCFVQNFQALQFSLVSVACLCSGHCTQLRQQLRLEKGCLTGTINLLCQWVHFLFLDNRRGLRLPATDQPSHGDQQQPAHQM